MDEATKLPIGPEEVAEAAQILQRYKAGKAALDKRLVDNELWFRMGHWKNYQNPMMEGKPQPSSGWLFNSIANKHADAMDNYPSPNVLPRAEDDEAAAQALSSVLPVVLEQADYEQVYSDTWWRKLKQGTGVKGVFWDPEQRGGVGEIAIRPMNLLMLYWEPGVDDIQASPHFFSLSLANTAQLESRWPQLAGHTASVLDVPHYIHDGGLDTSDKSVVVDWYYKVKSPNGKTLVHYVKFVGDTLLYASENDPECRDRGFYDHGLYPVVLDVLFPEKGTPVGFGYVAICKDPQLYVDKLSSNILENAMMAAKRRYFASDSTNINEDEFMDWNKPIVHVQGELDDRRLKEIVCSPLDDIYVNIMQMKIEEMKDTAANRDVNSGGVGSGVTAAAAIAALQEAGNKASRDMISASYRAHTQINSMCIELIRQFYDVTRSFRIISPNNSSGYDFVDLNNSKLQDQPMGAGSDGQMLYRKPIFDIKIKAQKKNPFSRMEQNERAKELYNLGFFNPERAQESLGCLDMMDFEGIDKVREYIKQGQTLLNICMQLQQENQLLKVALMGPQAQANSVNSAGNAAGGSKSSGGAKQSAQAAGAGSGLASGIMEAQQPMTGYGENLAKRSKPDMNTK